MIYVIQSGDHVKIGYCGRDPIRRLEKLQVGNPITLRLIALMRGGRGDERDWHGRFESLRVRGEWFRITPRLRRAIEPHLVDHDEASRNRPERMIEGVPAHKIHAFLDAVASGNYQEPTPTAIV